MEGSHTGDNVPLERRETSDETIRESNQEFTPPNDAHKLPFNDHGNQFQLKLLVLFIIRAINKEYTKFFVGTELDEFAGKFDDVILIKVENNTNSYLYLQAKHIMSDAKSITAADILNDNDKGKFSLPKYFRSYYSQIKEAENGPKDGDHVDCFICTNINFDDEDLKTNGIELEPIAKDPSPSPPPRDLLIFDTAVQYRIKSIDWLRFVANVLYKSRLVEPECKPESILDQQGEVFKSYLVALFKENVLIELSQSVSENGEKKKSPKTKCTTLGFHSSFTAEEGICETIGAKKLRKILTDIPQNDDWKSWKFSITKKAFQAITKEESVPEVINLNLDDQFGTEKLNCFLKIFAFAANTPNENKLDAILNREFGQCLKLFDTDLQSL